MNTNDCYACCDHTINQPPLFSGRLSALAVFLCASEGAVEAGFVFPRGLELVTHTCSEYPHLSWLNTMIHSFTHLLPDCFQRHTVLVYLRALIQVFLPSCYFVSWLELIPFLHVSASVGLTTVSTYQPPVYTPLTAATLPLGLPELKLLQDLSHPLVTPQHHPPATARFCIPWSFLSLG